MGPVPRPLRAPQALDRHLRALLQHPLHPRARGIRCPLLRPDPAQKHRLTEIRANLAARIAEAEREGWTGEAEGLKASLAAAGHKLVQMNQITASRNRAVDLGMPAFGTVTGRTVTIPPTHKPDTR
jgi:hypothetical protein